MEEHWFNTSTSGKEFIEITESELDEILKGSESDNIVQEAEESSLIFRL